MLDNAEFPGKLDSMTEPSSSLDRRRFPSFVALALGAAFLCLGVFLFGAGGNDDSHITYWSAHTLATQGKILSYNGVPLEQSSSLTLVVLLALLHALTRVPLPTLGWAVSMAAGAATIVLLARRHPAAGLLAAASLPLLYWSTSGMESSLTALLLIGVVALAERFLDGASPGSGSRRTPEGAVASPSPDAPGEGALSPPSRSRFSRLPLVIVLACAAASRPEAPLLLVCMTGALALVEIASGSSRRKAALELVAWTLAVSALLILLRLAFFGLPVPNPASMKTGGFALAGGARYALRAVKHLGWILPICSLLGLAVIAIDLIRRRPLPPSRILIAAAGLAGICFCLLSGGDWMPAGRFVVPAIPFLALLAALAIRRLPWASLRAVVVLAAATGALWGTVDFAGTSTNTGRPHLQLAATRAVLEEAWGPLPFVYAELANKAHLRDAGMIPAVLEVLADLAPTAEHQVVLASGQAGMVPYHVFQPYFGKVRFLDLFGLTDDALVRCLPRNKMRRSILGVGPSEAWLISHPEALERCGIPRPDVIYNVGLRAEKREILRKAGYTIVYENVGSMRSPHPLFPSGGNASAYVAVRDDLLDRVHVPVAKLIFPLESGGPSRIRRTAPPPRRAKPGVDARASGE